MKTHYSAVLLAAAMLAGSAVSGSTANAQNPILLDAYGRGVHQFYSGQTRDAYQTLQTAVTGGLQDPRAYYFLGMASSQLGNRYEAESFWQQGAKLEAEGRIVGSVGRALQRFQGSQRLKLEEIRRKAKLEYLTTAAAKSRQRYGEIRAAESTVLRGGAPAASPILGRDAAAPPMAPPAPPVGTAAADPMAPPTGQPAVDQPDAFPDAMNNPFADEPAAADAGTAPADPAANPFGDAPAEPAADNPFGNSDDNPFGDDDPFN